MKINKSIIFFLVILTIVSTFLSCSQGQADAPSGMKLLSNDFADYNMYVPEAWVIVSDESTGYSSAYQSELNRSNVTVTAFELKKEKNYSSLDEFWSEYEEDFKDTFSEIEIISNQRTTLDGYEAKSVEYTATITGIKYKYMQLFCIRGRTVYMITYTSSEEKYDAHIEKIWAMVNEFNFK